MRNASRGHRDRDHAMEVRVQRQMHDTRFNGLRTRAARRCLVALMAAWFALVPLAWLAGNQYWGIAAVIAAATTWWALQVSVRTVADLPEEYLDERQAALRDRAYVEAYRWLAGIVTVMASAGLLAFIVLGQDPDTWAVSLSWNGCMAVFWTVMAPAVALPSMIVAVRERPEAPAGPPLR